MRWPRGRWWWWAFLAVTVSAGGQEVTQILSNGPTAKRINIVFLAEGYLASQTNLFAADVGTVLTNIILTPPFNAYSNYFNAYSIFVASVEEGSDHPASQVFKDTYFNSSYDSYGIGRLITIPPNDLDGSYSHGQGRVNALLQNLIPEYDLSVLIVNDTDYGGSGGSALIASVNGSSAEIVVHELGHNYSGLGDEYDLEAPAYPDNEEPNTTRETERWKIKWRDWIQEETPVPTPEVSAYASVVGLFEGAHYHATGWYRPKFDCKMKTLGVEFCEVCSEALIKSTYALVRPIESCAPPTNALIELVSTQQVTLQITPLQPAAYHLNVQWFANGLPVSDATNPVFHIAAVNLKAGLNAVKVEVTDPTSKVRNDPSRLLRDRRMWRISAQLEPWLEVRRWQDQIILSWPEVWTGFKLQSKIDLDPHTPWMLSGEAPVLTNDRFTVTNLVVGGALYYRLSQ